MKASNLRKNFQGVGFIFTLSLATTIAGIVLPLIPTEEYAFNPIILIPAGLILLALYVLQVNKIKKVYLNNDMIELDGKIIRRTSTKNSRIYVVEYQLENNMKNVSFKVGKRTAMDKHFENLSNVIVQVATGSKYVFIKEVMEY